jgi:hypothetical protein
VGEGARASQAAHSALQATAGKTSPGRAARLGEQVAGVGAQIDTSETI